MLINSEVSASFVSKNDNKNGYGCIGEESICAVHVGLILFQSRLWGDLQGPAYFERGEHPAHAYS